MIRAQQRLMIVVPLTLLIIILIIYLNTQSWIKTMIVLLAVPFSLVGAFWMLYLFGYNMSVAVWIGVIALAGLDAETGVVMLLYLDLAYDEWIKKGLMRGADDLRDAIYHGAVKRVRPKAMTAAVIIAGLAADPLEPRRRRGRHEADRHADDRRCRDFADHGAGGLPGDLFPVAKSAFLELPPGRGLISIICF